MPIYEYICNECGNRFEQFTWSSAEAGEIACPACGSCDARKVMSAFGLGRTGVARADPACGPVG